MRRRNGSKDKRKGRDWKGQEGKRGERREGVRKGGETGKEKREGGNWTWAT